MSDTNLTQKFNSLQSQLTAQHADVMGVLNTLRTDVGEMKSDIDSIRISGANTEQFALQIAQSNVSIYDRLQTLNEIYGYLTRDADQGLDVLGRLNFLMARSAELNTYVDGLETALSTLQTAIDAIKYSVAPTPAMAMAVKLNAMNNRIYVLEQAITGDVSSWTGTTMMERIGVIETNAIQTNYNTSVNGSTLGDILAALPALQSSVDSIKECACATPVPDPCDAGVMLPVSYLSSEGLRTLSIVNPETTDTETGIPITCDSFFDPVNSGGTTANHMQWNTTAPAIIPVGQAEFCVSNLTSNTIVHAATLDVSSPSPIVIKLPVSPGTKVHFTGNGPTTYLAVWVDSLPTGEEDKISIVAFGAG